MCLQNGLKIEGETIPQRKFARSGASQNSSTCWRPLRINILITAGEQGSSRGVRHTVTTLTGPLTLFVLVCTNFVHKLVDALSG
jgi:hypothetical protein